VLLTLQLLFLNLLLLVLNKDLAAPYR
jgi:hypothetical protein